MPPRVEPTIEADEPVAPFDAKPPRTLRRIRAWFRRTQLPSLERNAAAALLLTVAGIHAVFVVREDLTQWKGGGFGMFSTVDAGGARTFRVDLYSGGSRYRAILPADTSIRDLVKVTRRLPSDHNVEQFLGFLAGTVWVLRSQEGGEMSGSSMAPEDPSEEASREADRQIGPGELIATGRGLERLVPWNPDRVTDGRVMAIDRVVVTFFKLRYDRETRESKLVPMGSMEAPGMSADEMAEALDLPVDYLKENWM